MRNQEEKQKRMDEADLEKETRLAQALAVLDCPFPEFIIRKDDAGGQY